MNLKKQLNLYSFYDLGGMAEHLSRMAAQGWFLQKTGAMFWQYTQGEPRNLTYSICCAGEISAFDATKEEPSLRVHGQKAGWDVVLKNDKYMIFSTEKEDAKPVGASPYDRISGISQAAKPGLFLNFTLMALGILSVLLFLFRLNVMPVDALSGALGLMSPVVLLLIGGFSLADTIFYFRWKSAAEIGATKNQYIQAGIHLNRARVSLGLLSAVLLIIALAGSGGSSMLRTFFVYLAAIVTALLVLGAIREGLRSGEHKGLVVLVNGALAVILVVGLLFSMGRFHQVDQGLDGSMPLTAPDLGLAEESDNLNQYMKTKSSFLLGYSEASQVKIQEDGSYASLISYEMVEGRAVPVDGKVLQYYLDRMQTAVAVSEDGTQVPGYTYAPMDESLFGARKAWQMQDATKSYNVYLLLFENRLVELGSAEPLTGEQMAICGSKLAD